MAAIRAHGGILAFTSGNSIAVSDIRSPNAFHIIKLPAGMEGKPAKADEDDGAGSGRTGAGEGSGEGSGLNRTLASAFSCRGRYFAVCDDLKKLHIFCTDSPSWTLLSSRTVARRATSLTFTRDDTTVLVADKSGDVYSFPVLTHTNGQEDNEVKDEGKVKDESQVKDEEEEEVKDGSEEKTEGQLVLGHLSMVLDVCLAAEDQYVVTCDRDEKIRISHHPNGYNIHAFCLGHTQFVSCLQYIKEFRMLISGSGDGSLAAWNMQGKQLCRARLPEKTKPTPVAPQQPSRLRPEHEEGGDKNDDASGDNDDDDEEEKEEERRKEEEGEERRAVRQLVYSEGHRLLLVACYSQAEVEVYEVRGEGGLTTTTTTTATTLTHLQTLPVPAAPWSMAWDDSSDTLWVLAPVQGLTLSAFQLRKKRKEEGEVQLHRVTEVMEADMDVDRSSGVVKTVHTVNKHWPFFADSLNVADELQGLWKTCRQDNVLQYQQRKQKRLQAHHHHQQQQQQKPQPGKKAKKRQKRGRGEEEAEDLTAGETTAPAAAAAAAAATASEERGSEGLPGKKTRHSS